MYKKIVLEAFEKREWCELTNEQFDEIKREIESTISILNEGIERGRDFLESSYMQSYDRELYGMKAICTIIGVFVKINKERS
ncbi:hypothetical protein [Cytobacillus firmus]|uniref:hypothetical protein n=1 Tax=Cytobacillus firmus TaxID=1399 RepID=UPI0018CEC803|nr:hypothetical protein [Cytobacillus firmus]MBG9586897.1 hypothetical protein [Cytobacillus firmus]